MEMRKYPNRDSVSTIGKTVPEHLIHQPFYKATVFSLAVPTSLIGV